MYIYEGISVTVQDAHARLGKARSARLASVCIEHAIRLGGPRLFFSVGTIVGTLFIAQLQWFA